MNSFERRYLIPFRSQLLPHVFTDTLVIGGGVAGMRAALEAARDGGDVTLLIKGDVDQSSTAWAQGGIAVASGEGDSADVHHADTVEAGAGLCDFAAVSVLVNGAAQAVEELLEWGMRFDRDARGELDYGREGAHSRDRVVHSDGARTGRELVRCLADRIRAVETVRIFDNCFALDLLTTDRGEPRVLGAVTHHRRFGLQVIWAKATILATGGAGQVYRETTNPKVTTGDGLAMAWRAGAAVGDVEFVQFHPTTLYVAGSARHLISEAVRGEGAHLVDRDGVRFMIDRHPQAELAPRDVVSRAIMEHGGPAFLDMRAIGGDRLRSRFPGMVQTLAAFDLDPGADLIPVHPSAHYTIGGVWTDLDGRATLPGLLACGEAACLGLHGANRLASNSLLEGLVFGRRAGRAAAKMNGQASAPIRIVSECASPEHAELDIVDVAASLRSAMWRNVGIVRTGRVLDDVLDMFNFWGHYTMDMIFEEPDGWELQNMLTVGALITRAARHRCESRGTHYRGDHPDPRSEFAHRALWRAGRAEPELLPVPDPREAAVGA